MNVKLSALILSSIFFWVCGCSVIISTPRQAEIRVQGLNDQFRSEFVTLDDLVEQNLEIPLSNKHALMLDFQWLLGSDEHLDSEAPHNIVVESELAPWLTCQYRF